METNNLVKSIANRTAQTALFRSVYVWMTLALAITGFVALYVAKSYTLINAMAQNSMMFWILLIAEVGLVMFLSARIHRISFTTATILFILYSVLNGVTMSVLFMVLRLFFCPFTALRGTLQGILADKIIWPILMNSRILVVNSMKIGNHLLNGLMALNGVKRIRNLTAGSDIGN